MDTGIVNSGRRPEALAIAAAVSALGGFLFGYDNIVISGAIKYLVAAFRLDDAGVGWAATRRRRTCKPWSPPRRSTGATNKLRP
jgi:hypothetical protein